MASIFFYPNIVYLLPFLRLYYASETDVSVEGLWRKKRNKNRLWCFNLPGLLCFWVAVQTQGGFVRTAGTSPDHRTAASIKNRTLNGSVVFQQRQQTCLFQHEGRSRRLKRLFLYMSFIRCKYLWERYISMYEAFFFFGEFSELSYSTGHKPSSSIEQVSNSNEPLLPLSHQSRSIKIKII